MTTVFLSKKEKQVLRAQGKSGENRKVADLTLGISRSHLNTTNTRIYVNFIEALETFNEYYPIFERRLVENADQVKELLLGINRRLNQSVRVRRGR